MNRTIPFKLLDGCPSQAINYRALDDTCCRPVWRLWAPWLLSRNPKQLRGAIWDQISRVKMFSASPNILSFGPSSRTDSVDVETELNFCDPLNFPQQSVRDGRRSVENPPNKRGRSSDAPEEPPPSPRHHRRVHQRGTCA